MSVKTLPPRRIFPTPRPIISDAYTIGGRDNESPQSTAKSVYYMTARRFPHAKHPMLFPDQNDQRIVFGGMQRIVERLLRKPITHDELDEAAEFFINRKVTTQGLADFDWNEELWRRVVDEYEGYPPIRITALPEGSVVYPHEPMIRVESMADGFGILAAHFESSLMHVWAATCRLTAVRHWYAYYCRLFSSLHPDWDDEKVHFHASLMMHDFGARASVNNQENEDVAYMALYCFGGTDTFEAAYQAYKNGAPLGTGVSVKALAHRNVQAWEHEVDCYNHMYETAEDGELLSMVADCYDYHRAVEHMLLPLALRSSNENRGIVVVARPDSGDALEQIIWTLNLADAHGLSTVDESTGLKNMTTLRIIEGDSMRWGSMREINKAVLAAGFDPAGCFIYGVGGGQRNDFTRDDYSLKYAICAVGNERRPVLKLSEVEGKRTLPEVKVLRTPEALESGVTLVGPNEAGEDAHVVYFDGSHLTHPFGPGFDDDFATIQNRVLNEFDEMPLNAGQVSDEVRGVCETLTARYRAEGILS